MQTSMLRLFACLMALGLFASACGGGDDADTGDETEESVDAGAEAEADETPAEEAEDEEGEEAAEEAADGDAEDGDAEDGDAGDGDAEDGDAEDGAEAAGGYMPAAPECVAPADAGGGWDFTCRSIGQLFEDLDLTDNVVVINQPGGGGAVAFADIAGNRGDDSDLVIAASPATAIRFAQNQYTGLEADQFRWIGAIGADFGVVAVTADSEFETFEQLMEAVTADPEAVVFGGGSPIGGQDHFKVLLLSQELGIDPAIIPWVAYDGGGEAQNALIGGEIEVATLDVSETIGNDELRILAVMAEERVPGMDDVPTTRELGFETIFPIWRGLLAPGDMSDEAYDFWVNAMGEVEASPEWAAAREENGLSPLRLIGDDFQAFALDAVADFRTLSEPFGLVAEG